MMNVNTWQQWQEAFVHVLSMFGAGLGGIAGSEDT